MSVGQNGNAYQKLRTSNLWGAIYVCVLFQALIINGSYCEKDFRIPCGSLIRGITSLTLWNIGMLTSLAYASDLHTGSHFDSYGECSFSNGTTDLPDVVQLSENQSKTSPYLHPLCPETYGRTATRLHYLDQSSHWAGTISSHLHSDADATALWKHLKALNIQVSEVCLPAFILRTVSFFFNIWYVY